MAFLNPFLLSALGLVAIPVILHLLLRPKPKQLIFPALRLIRERRKQNVRRFRLRHWWLLFLRMAAIGMIVFALTRPTLPAANYSFSRTELLTLITVTCAGIATYYLILNRWQRASLPRYVFEYRRTSLRTWSTAAVLLALALAVGWPYQRRIRAEIKSPPTTRQLDIPVAAVFLFDSSLSMEYQYEGRTRLQVAQQLALDHLSELPSGSRVAVSDNASDDSVSFHPTLAIAQQRIESLEVNAVAHPLGDRVRKAIVEQRDDRQRVVSEFGFSEDDDDQAAARQDRYLRRIYIFTDLARSAWSFTGSRILQGEISDFEGLRVYLIDVGVLEPQNLGITDISLSKQRVPVGGNLFVNATVTPRGMADRGTVAELLLADSAGNLAKREQRTVTFLGDVPQQVQFQLTDLSGPVEHGVIRLVSSDPLDVDDTRYFTVEVGDPFKVLVFARDYSSADNWLFALDPTESQKFDVEFRPYTQLDQPFGDADVVYLINVPEVSEESWHQLGHFVEAGGGLGVFLGSDDISADSYNRAQAQVFLPATLDVWMPQNSWRMSLGDTGHPMLRKFRDYADGVAILENDVHIYRFWKVVSAGDSTVVIRFTDVDESPALVERTFEDGRVVMFTSDVDRKPHPYRWNNFPSPSADVVWPFIAFAEQMTEHLAGSTEVVVNYIAGEEPFITLGARPEERTFLIREPGLVAQNPLSLAPGGGTLVIKDLDTLGSYDLFTSGERRELVAGFSLNAPAGESDFTRLLEDELDQLLGEETYYVARSIEELQGEIQASDIGQEMFPLMLVLVIACFCGEHFVANRFYDPEAEAAVENSKQSSQTA